MDVKNGRREYGGRFLRREIMLQRYR